MSRVSRSLRVVAWLGLLLLGAASGRAQQSATPPAPEQISPALPAGTRSYAPGTWGLVEVSVANRAEEPAKVLSSLFFDGDPNQQYGRELWIPARSRRTAWHPVLVPPATSTAAASFDFQALFIDRTGPEERFIPSTTGQMLSDGLLPIDRAGRLTGWIGDFGPEGGEASGPAVIDMIAAARVAAGLSRRVVALRGHVLPPGAETMQGMEHLVLSNDRPLADPAGLAAIRHWVRRGGRLWVVLNQVSPETVERLLEGDARIETVDRVGLTTVRIEGIGSASRSSDREPREFERPVEMVRVLADGVEVLHRVDGWPASFMQRSGRGEVLFTTLEPTAWVRLRQPQDPKPPGRETEPPWVALEPLADLAARLMGQSEPVPNLAPPARAEAIWEPLLAEQIGYRVVGRGTVLAVMGLSCVLLGVAAVWLGRRQRLERMGLIAPLTSLATAGVLAAIGLQKAEAVPSTVAEGQLVETTPGSVEARVSGLVMMYSQESDEVSLGSDAGGVFMPDMTGFAGETRRMVWTDWDRWHWENLTLPRGVRLAPFQQDVRLESPSGVRGAFGPDGFSGRVTGPLRELSDLVLATPSGGSLAVRPNPDGEFAAGPQDVLGPGAYVAGVLLSDTQRRRQELYRRLLAAEGRRGGYGDRPTLLGWGRPLELGFVYPKESVRIGEALVALPLEIDRTPPGTRVTIPTPFVTFDTASHPDAGVPSPLFDRRTGEAAERTGDIESWLRFQLPAEVVPLDVAGAVVTIEAAGAIDGLELLGRSGGRTVSLQTWQRPVGTLRVPIDRGDVLVPDERGGLLLGLRVNGAEEPLDEADEELRQYWRIDSVRLQATGRTPDAAGGD